MSNIKNFVSNLSYDPIGNKERLLADLKVSGLTRDEMNIVYKYFFPTPLEDYGLPPRIAGYRVAHGISDCGDPSEVAYLVEACKTEQYGRFMKHLMHAYENPEQIFPVSGEEEDTCVLCGKRTLGYSRWQKECPTDYHRHYLSFSCSESSSTLCIDCLSRLIETKEIMEELDPGFLDWTKRYREALNNIRPI